ncbi:MAG: class I SAM-dependent methyltransferase, partial [Candidatus Krumholzibacteriia bacterium]
MWRFKKRIRGKKIKATSLRKTAWKDIAPDTKVAIFAPKKVDGNVTLIELAMTSAFAGAAEPGTTLFEIGTFDGRTTLNLAGNAPNGCSVVTLDLPPDTQTKNQLTDGERIWVNKPTSGARFTRYGGGAATAGITQLYGDSADFDFSPFRNRCSLVFVDGSHSYENVLSDSRNAFEMVRTGGVVLWHDYGVWED